MNSLKMGAAAVGALLTLLAASKDAQASVIAPEDSVATLHGGAGAAAFWTVDGADADARHDNAGAWTMALHNTNGGHAIRDTAFHDALKSDDWILSTTSDYFRWITHTATIPRARSFFSTVTQGDPQ